jgi:hypothetical protein
MPTETWRRSLFQTEMAFRKWDRTIPFPAKRLIREDDHEYSGQVWVAAGLGSNLKFQDLKGCIGLQYLIFCHCQETDIGESRFGAERKLIRHDPLLSKR